jgi:serine/threonine-protein kinase
MQALGKTAETAEGQAVLAEVCYQMKFYSQAILHYQEALRRDPRLAEAHNNLAWLYATSEDQRYRNPQKALEHARRAVQLTEWKEPNFIDTLAEAFFVNNRFDEAVQTQSKALKLAPDNREFQEHMEKYRKAAGSSYTLARPSRPGRLGACIT